jgi:DNA polymerase-3 subunit alpha
MDPAEAWAEALKLKHEKETLGFYITGHPLRKYADEVRAYGNATTGTLSEKPSGFEVSIGGIVSAIRVTRTKKGDSMAIVQLEDWEGIVEVLMFPDTYSKVHRLLEADAAIIVKGKLDNDEASMKILATDVHPMERAREILSKTVTVQIDATTAPADLAEQMQPIIDRKRGSAEIIFALNFRDRFTAFVRPNPYVKVLPDRELIESIERICGTNSVTLQ